MADPRNTLDVRTHEDYRVEVEYSGRGSEDWRQVGREDEPEDARTAYEAACVEWGEDRNVRLVRRDVIETDLEYREAGTTEPDGTV